MSGVRKWNFISFNVIAGAIALLGFVGCSMDTKSKPIVLPAQSIAKKVSGGEAAPKEPDPIVTAEPAVPPVVSAESLTMNLVDLSAGGRQRKSSSQLQKSFLACVGAQSEGDESPVDEVDPSIFRVSNEMFINDNSTSRAKGRFGFLIVGSTADVAGKSILELEKPFIDVAGSASGVKASTLEDELYLNSLQNIASVIAFNCNVESESSQCFCSTRQKAKEMVERCLTLFDNSTSEFNAAFEGFAEACNTDTSDEGLFQRRKAIVSLLSSYAFATAR